MDYFQTSRPGETDQEDAIRAQEGMTLVAGRVETFLLLNVSVVKGSSEKRNSQYLNRR